MENLSNNSRLENLDISSDSVPKIIKIVSFNNDKLDLKECNYDNSCNRDCTSNKVKSCTCYYYDENCKLNLFACKKHKMCVCQGDDSDHDQCFYYD